MKKELSVYRGLLCMLILFPLCACQEIRLSTYPTDFTWIGKEHLKTTMHEMANSVSKLNTLLDTELNDTSKQRLIVQELDQIESYAMTLSGGDDWSASDRKHTNSNHILLNDNLEVFINTVGKARLQAQSVPASYYGVGKITGGCSSCHRLR